MDMTQTLIAELVMIMLFALMPMLGMMQARRTQRSKIKFFMPEDDKARARRTGTTRLDGKS